MLDMLTTIVDVVGVLGGFGAAWLYAGLTQQQHRDTRIVLLAIGTAFAVRLTCDLFGSVWCSPWIELTFRSIVAGSLMIMITRRMIWWQHRGFIR